MEFPDPHWVDYLVLGVFLSVCMGIGVYFSRQKSSGLETYLLGNRQLMMIPVAISLFVTFASAISLMGIPSEVYVYGTMIFYVFVGVLLAQIVMAYTIVPMVFPLQLTSSYEYLERRFQSKSVRYLGACIGILQTVCYMGVTLYAPALALQTVAKIPLWLSIVVIGGIGTIYTSIGGIKSVIWTDVFQFLMIFIGLGSIAVKGCISIGNASSVWTIPKHNGRLDLQNFNFDPRVRHTVWGTIIGGCLTWVGNFCNQSSIQRIVSVRTLKDAKRCFQLNFFIGIFFGLVLVFVGLVMYAYYNVTQCDPLEAGFIKDMNQLIPFFVFDVLRQYPGLSGVFMSCLFSGTLSTISSGINALATNTLKDIIEPSIKRYTRISPTSFAKLLALVYGALSICLAYVMQFSPGPVVQMALSVFGACGGPLGGLFFLGGLFPNTNYIGALTGGISALVFNFWIGIGARFYGRNPIKLTLNDVSGCNLTMSNASLEHVFNVSTFKVITTDVSVLSTHYTMQEFESNLNGSTFVHFLYNISYIWYGTIGFALTVVIGLLVSCCTGRNRGHKVSHKYIIPCFRRFWSIKNDTEYITLTYPNNVVELKSHILGSEQAKDSSIQL